jgi:hypothetical protein
VRITLSNGKTVTARPVGVGNEDLFAFPTGRGVTPAGWVSYDAAGHQTGAGSVGPAPGTAAGSGSGSAKP